MQPRLGQANPGGRLPIELLSFLPRPSFFFFCHHHIHIYDNRHAWLIYDALAFLVLDIVVSLKQ